MRRQRGLTPEQHRLVAAYTEPLSAVSGLAWSFRADYIERATGSRAAGELVGDRVYRLLYG
jgi:hypothetical protein